MSPRFSCTAKIKTGQLYSFLRGGFLNNCITVQLTALYGSQRLTLKFSCTLSRNTPRRNCITDSYKGFGVVGLKVALQPTGIGWEIINAFYNLNKGVEHYEKGQLV